MDTERTFPGKARRGEWAEGMGAPASTEAMSPHKCTLLVLVPNESPNVTRAIHFLLGVDDAISGASDLGAPDLADGPSQKLDAYDGS